MKTILYYLAFVAAGCLLVASAAEAQRGAGDPVGVARQAVQPLVVPVSGVLKEVHVGPCEHTTGKSVIGTHLMIETDQGVLTNIHLGPEQEVDHVVRQLLVDQPIQVDAFETTKLPVDHRVAQKIEQDGKVFVLRDENLRPTWAAGRRPGYGPRRNAYGYVDCPRGYSVYRYPPTYRYQYGYPGWRRGYGRGHGYGYGPRRVAIYYGPGGRPFYYRRAY